MNLKKISLVSFINSLLVSSILVMTLGCSGGGGQGTTSDNKVTQKSFSAAVDGTKVVFGSASFDATLKDDLPISSLATVSLTGKDIMIENAHGARAYEITLKFPDSTFSSFTSVSGDFITESPAKSEGVLATINWGGSSTPILESVILTDANGGSIAALVK